MLTNCFLAAMRLRQLATTQSVVFLAPPEVNQSILDLRNKTAGDHIDSTDVIHWLLEQTCNGIEQLQPLYHSQGIDYCRRRQAALDNSEYLVNHGERQKLLDCLRQPEQQTLEQLYGTHSRVKTILSLPSFTPQIRVHVAELEKQRKSFYDSGIAVHGSALQEVEQEREVAHEVENVREVQKPVHYLPHIFGGVHRDIINFVNTGKLAAESSGYEQAFLTLRRTTLSNKHPIDILGTTCRLHVSVEVTRTIKKYMDHASDNFLVSLQYVLCLVIPSGK
jgi:hypothetical protein